jgi:PLP dependent protein
MSLDYGYLRDNLENILSEVREASEKSEGSMEGIQIIAVTKTIDIERIREIVDAGIIHLGENRVQELLEKYDIIDRECNWHLIGHLQTNKVKYIIEKVKMIHSVDRLELAQEIQKRAAKAEKVMDVLVQTNVSGEETKFGIAPEGVRELMRSISLFPNIKVRGLMTIAPFYENPEETREVFRALKKIFIDIKEENIDNIDMHFLSMGMSNDFQVAIEEGANLVRIGTAIFGKRQYYGTI